MIFKSDIVNAGQRWLNRLLTRNDESGAATAPGAERESVSSGARLWTTPAFFLHISFQANTLVKALNRTVVAAIDIGKSGFSALYDAAGSKFFTQGDNPDSKAFTGKTRLTAGKWSADACHVTLSPIGHLAGGIVENHSVLPENRHQFVEHVLEGRSSGRYDAEAFGEVRRLFKRDGVHPPG